MHILLYVPDNHVTRNFVPQLWPFLLQARTPSPHTVTIIDGNAVAMDEEELVRYIIEHQVGLVGMGFMTRMAQRAYAVAAAIRRETKVPVVFGGPHVTALPDEPLGRTGLERVADAVVLGEADDTWATVVEDAARQQLRDVYGVPVDSPNAERPALDTYRPIDWPHVDLALFDLMRYVPGPVRRLFKRMRIPYEKCYVIPVEFGRGCPYGCEFCTVTGFFGRHSRFRSVDSVIEELRSLKEVATRDRALVNVFFIDDNFAIDRTRLKALLGEMVRQEVCLPWVAQISSNLLGDEELLGLMKASGGRFVFMGLESVDPVSLKSAHKAFNRPEHYAAVLERLASYDMFAITSFIVGLEGDCDGVSDRTAAAIETWPPVLPVFGLLTPYPATPLYNRLEAEGRLTRRQHWLDFRPFKITFQPRHLTPEAAEREVGQAWHRCYTPQTFARTQRWLVDHEKAFSHQVMFFVARFLFTGIYAKKMTTFSWLRLLGANIGTLARLVRVGLGQRQAPHVNRPQPALVIPERTGPRPDRGRPREGAGSPVRGGVAGEA